MNNVAWKCFLLEPLGLARESCTVWCSQCDTQNIVEIGVIPYERPSSAHTDWNACPWPTQCTQCGHEFDSGDDIDRRSMHRAPLYRANGEVATSRDFGVGAMWEAPWYAEHGIHGDDGRCFIVRLPGERDWVIDGKASNCDRRDQPHHCWCRHGEPPDFTVDKTGSTCTAGGGSIWVDQPNGWHGFLKQGWLVAVDEQVPA